MHNRYLSFCYDKLCNITGSLIVIGFGFGEYDTHIIDSINKAAHQGGNGSPDTMLVSVKIGVNSQGGLDRLNKLISEKRFKCKKVEVFNAQTANIWNK